MLLCTRSGKGDRTPRSLGAQTRMGNNKEKQEDDRVTAGGSWPQGQGRAARTRGGLCCIGCILFPEPGGEVVDGSFIISVGITVL